MSIVAATRYKDGRPVANFDPADGAACPDEGFEWIGLCEPEEAEMAIVARRYRLHALPVEDALSSRQLPKIEDYGDQLFVVARTARLEEGRVVYGETAVFVGRHFLVTVRHGSTRDHGQLRTRLEGMPRLLAQGPDYVLHAILDFIVDGYFPIVDSIEDDVLAMEDRLLEGFLKRDDIGRLFALRHDVIRFQRSLSPMEDLASKLVNLEFPCIDRETMPFFRDVLDHVRRAEFRMSALRDLLSTAIETSNLIEQQQQGVIARRLAAWAAILAVPTAIAGIYGMNFDVMPELRWKYGYFLVLGVMASICTTLYVRFRRSGWL